ncbi:MAG: ATP-dependent metallopeptidase FtsH/Yme1/Tma family protein, partial [Actinomycetota bacterium]
MNKLFKNPIFYLLIGIAAIWAVAGILNSGSSDAELTTSEFERKLKAGDVTEVEVFGRSGRIEGTLSDGSEFTSTYLSSDDLSQLFRDQPGEAVVANPENPNLWGSLLTSILPFIF